MNDFDIDFYILNFLAGGAIECKNKIEKHMIEDILKIGIKWVETDNYIKHTACRRFFNEYGSTEELIIINLKSWYSRHA